MLSSLLLVSCLIAGDAAGGDALKAKVDRLAAELSGDEKAVRTKAEQQLIELGPAILDVLPSPGGQTDEEAKRAILRIRQAIQKSRAQNAIEASTVTLHGRLKLSGIFAEIQNQTGNNITPPPQAAANPAADPEIQIDFDKTPFWQALDEVLDKAQLSIYPYGQPQTLQLVPRGPHSLPRVGRATIAGPLRIEPVRVTAVRDLRSATPASLQITLEVAWEPRLQPIAIKQQAANLKAVDSTGVAVAADDPESEKEAPLPRQGNSAVEMDISLAMPAQGAKEITSLKGSLQVMMLGRIETFKFQDLLKDKRKPMAQKIAAAKVELSDRKNGDAWEFNVKLSYDKDKVGDALESHRNWALQNKAYLEDADGKPIEPDSMETTSREANEIGVGYVFAFEKNKSPEKMTFVYLTPGLVVTKDFPFELKGIRLP